MRNSTSSPRHIGRLCKKIKSRSSGLLRRLSEVLATPISQGVSTTQLLIIIAIFMFSAGALAAQNGPSRLPFAVDPNKPGAAIDTKASREDPKVRVQRILSPLMETGLSEGEYRKRLMSV